jgi:hypothetical protein
MRKEGYPDEDPLLQVHQPDLVITAVDTATSFQNYGFGLINKLNVSRWASLTAI